MNLAIDRQQTETELSGRLTLMHFRIVSLRREPLQFEVVVNFFSDVSREVSVGTVSAVTAKQQAALNSQRSEIFGFGLGFGVFG
jgi:hypothetical protein